MEERNERRGLESAYRKLLESMTLVAAVKVLSLVVRPYDELADGVPWGSLKSFREVMTWAPERRQAYRRGVIDGLHLLRQAAEQAGMVGEELWEGLNELREETAARELSPKGESEGR